MIFGDGNRAFGGKSIVLAGDFAQLPPIEGSNVSLYSHVIGYRDSRKKEEDQRKAMGKSLWHQFTDVVILRQNMRQIRVSARDCAYRKMLENL